MTIFVGDDWAETHHDVHLMNDTGDRLAAKQFPEGLEGIAGLHALIAEHTTNPVEVIIGIETERGVWVQALIAADYRVYAINPLSVSHYRGRHNVAGAKSDPGDAKLSADLVRTDRHNHRPVAGDIDQAAGLKVLARTHQNLIWDRTRHTNRHRNDLREFFPAALEAFESLAGRDAVAVLTKAPHPDQARRLSVTQLRSALKRGGRQRNLEARATEIQAALRTPQLAAPPAVAVAFAATTKALIEVIAGLNGAIADIERELAAHFGEHPGADIFLSLPGLGVVLGVRVLAEFGDDPDRYDNAKSRRNYAGTSPLTIASGKKHAVLARHVRNRRLYDAIDQWAFCSLHTSPGCRLFYDQRRAAGDLHHLRLRPDRQPARRLPPRLPPDTQPLRRTHRMGTPPTSPNPDCCLTPSTPGASGTHRPLYIVSRSTSAHLLTVKSMTRSRISWIKLPLARTPGHRLTQTLMSN